MSTGDQTDMLGRLKSLLPNGWFGDNNPIRDALLWGYAQALAWGYTLYLYAKSQTRIKTATDNWLDLIALDFFGDSLIRHANQGDASYRNNILVSLFRERTTRHAMEQVLLDLTGRAPIIIEPSRPADVGAYGAAVAVLQAGTTTMIDNGVVVYVPANTPRFEGGQLLIESAATNLAKNSEVIEPGSGVVVTPYATAAPSGANTANAVFETASNGEHYAGGVTQVTYPDLALINPLAIVLLGGDNENWDTYTWSVFVKDAPSANRQLYLEFATAAVRFNPRTKELLFFGGAQGGFKALANGWYRVWITEAWTATESFSARIRLVDDAGNTSYQGDGHSGLYLWGLQLELNDTPTSYIPTGGSTASRSADAQLNNMTEGSIGIGGYAVAGSYGSISLPYQAFVTAFRPLGQGLPYIAGYGISTGGYSTPSRSDYAEYDEDGVTDADIFAAIAATKPEGTAVWARLAS